MNICVGNVRYSPLFQDCLWLHARNALTMVVFFDTLQAFFTHTRSRGIPMHAAARLTCMDSLVHLTHPATKSDEVKRNGNGHRCKYVREAGPGSFSSCTLPVFSWAFHSASPLEQLFSLPFFLSFYHHIIRLAFLDNRTHNGVDGLQSDVVIKLS